MRTHSLNVLPSTHGVGQNISPCMLRLLPGISFLLISTLPVHSPAYFFKTSPDFSCVGCGWHRLLCRPAEWNRSPCWMQVPVECLRNINRLKKHDLWYDDLWNEYLGDWVKFVFSPDVLLCDWVGSKHQLTNELSCFRMSVIHHPHSPRSDLHSRPPVSLTN